MVCVHVVVCPLCDAKDVWRHLQSVLAPIFLQCFVCVDAQIYRESSQVLRSYYNALTSEWVHRNQDGTDVGIDFSVRPALLQVLVDTFVADCREQCHIVHSNLFLLKPLLPIRLHKRLSEINQTLHCCRLLLQLCLHLSRLSSGPLLPSCRPFWKAPVVPRHRVEQRYITQTGMLTMKY